MKIIRLLFLTLLCVSALPARAQLTPGAPEVVSEKRIARTVFEYVMRAKVTNPDAALASLGATVTSTSPRTVIRSLLSKNPFALSGGTLNVATTVVVEGSRVD